MRISEKVRFTGFVDDKYELSRLYAESDILVVPSTYPEGVPRVIDEALLHGMLVVASAVGGIPGEFYNGEVLLVPPGDVGTLVATLQKLICNPEFHDKQLTVVIRYFKDQDNPTKQHASFLKEMWGVVD